jgi:hypothetical protein
MALDRSRMGAQGQRLPLAAIALITLSM